MLSVIVLSAIMLSAIMLSVIMLSAIMLSVIMLSVVAPHVQVLQLSLAFLPTKMLKKLLCKHSLKQFYQFLNLKKVEKIQKKKTFFFVKNSESTLFMAKTKRYRGPGTCTFLLVIYEISSQAIQFGRVCLKRLSVRNTLAFVNYGQKSFITLVPVL